MSKPAWRHATKADLPALQQFVCCLPPPRRFGTSRRGTPTHAHRAQSAIRDIDLHKVTVQLGCDDEGIAAVYAYSADWSDGFVFLGVAGVRLNLQRQGLGQGMMTRFLSEITAGAIDRGLQTIRIGTNVEPTNEPSLKLLSRWSWQYTGQQAGPMQRWETYILVGGA